MKIADAERAKDKDRNTNAGSPQDNTFLDVGTREDRRTGLLECRSDFRRPVAVRVRFDDGDDFRNGRVSRGSEETRNRAKV
jgi:hypothetical protein